MLQRICVEPLGEGWLVRSSLVDNDMPFHSGAAAETAARALAERLRHAGLDCEIQIFLRDGTLAARFACPAAQDLALHEHAGGEGCGPAIVGGA